ncbi:MAG TPA: hypothetical protein PKC91_00320 [Ignavibacteria bacterium]|nr:hypothetical protein [Ignavibacteria bacterium]
MAAGICGKTEKIFEGIGVSLGRLKNRSVIKSMAEHSSVQNAFDIAGMWISTVKCRKTCSAKTSSTEYVSISRFEEDHLPGGMYRCTVRTKILVKLECKDIMKIPVKKWVVG